MTSFKRKVVRQSNGTVEIREPDGTVVLARSVRSYERILELLRKAKRPYIHMSPKP